MVATADSPEPGGVDRARRFGGIDRLYGAGAVARLERARVAVVGIGGVGSWAAEALVRSGLGSITLIDLDHVAESNLNRQAQALENTLGMAKVDAMAARLAAINPDLRCHRIDDFLTRDNVATGLADVDLALDATDQLSAKLAMVLHCRERGLPLVVSGGAGGKRAPQQLAVDDLARTTHDPLLARVRSELRRRHAFPREPGKRFGVEAVFLAAPMTRMRDCDADAVVQPHGAPGGGAALSCAGYGSSMMVTASVGLCMAARALEHLLTDVA